LSISRASVPVGAFELALLTMMATTAPNTAASMLPISVSCSVAERLRNGRPPVRRARLGSGPLAGSNSASMGSGSSWTGRFVSDHHPHGVRMPVPR
jgi:hypothetical protein